MSISLVNEKVAERHDPEYYMKPRLVSATKTGKVPNFLKQSPPGSIPRSDLKENTMSFKTAALNYINEAPARTANGMKARATSASAVLDFFGKAGSSRGTALVREFTAALVDNQDLVVRALLWTRDIRSGAGERKQFRDLLVALESANPDLAGRLMHKIPFLGRFDDLFVYADPINRRKALEIYQRERDRFKHAKPEMTGAYYLAGGHGPKDDNQMPQFVEICPAYGAGWVMIYEDTGRTISYEGS